MSKKYEEIVYSSGIASPGLVKGTLFIHPKGWGVWENIKKFLDKEFKSIGIKNVAFPSLIPLSEMEKEKSKLSGFHPELFLVKKTGDDEGNKVFLRPTSEILFSHFFKKTLHSHEQLPILLNQWCNVYRSEKNTKVFLRTCEFYWQEAHTLHKTEEDAVFFLNKFHEIYSELSRKILNLAFLNGEKTINERFQGAFQTLALEAVMPDGQALQIATSHYLGKNFSTIFEIKYSSSENKLENPYQISAGCSTRLLGALILAHSDSKGLVLPFWVADVQIKVLIVGEVVKKGDEIHNLISKCLHKYEVEWEFYSSKSFGFRMSHQEVLGIPFVLVVGEKELAEKKIMVKSRISDAKEMVLWDDLELYMEESIEKYSENLYSKSKEKLDSLVVDLSGGATLEKVKEEVLQNGKIVLVPWFDDEANEESFKAQKFNFGARCVKSRITDGKLKCFYSGRIANSYTYFGRSY